MLEFCSRGTVHSADARGDSSSRNFPGSHAMLFSYQPALQAKNT